MSDRSGHCVLITRPEPGASETAARVRVMGFVPLLAPMLTITPRDLRMHATPQAVLVTSANAIASLPSHLHHLKLFAVGDATAARATVAGFAEVASARRDAAALAELVLARCDPAAGPLLLASGAGQGLSLAAALRAQGFVVHRRIAYRARPVTQLPGSVISPLARGAIMAAMFFSPATAQAFAACMIGRTEDVAGVEALAISQPTARALNLLPWRRIRVASHPNQDELVALLS